MPRFNSSYPEHQLYEDHKVLFPSTAMVAGIYGAAANVEIPSKTRELLLILDVSAAALAVGDTLDATVVTRVYINGVAYWLDVCAFTQVLGNGGALTHVDKVVAGLDQATFADAALAAGAKRHILGDAWQAAITVFGATAAFTASIDMIPME